MTRAIRLSRCLALAAAVMTLAARAEASEQSEMLYSRGLVEFHAQRYGASLPWFDQAVAADASDATALYYRAMARARAEQPDGAIDDLKHALEIKPDFHRARIDLAALLIDKEQYDAAIATLEPVRQVPGMEGRAAFFVALAQLRQGNLDQARANFRYAGEKDPQLAATASYYEGVIAYRNDERGKARAILSSTLDKNPGRGVSHEAETLLQTIQNRGGRRYSLYAEAGLQADSNVCLLADDQNLGCQSPSSTSTSKGKDESDGRGVFTLGGLVHAYSSKAIDLTLGYEFFQSVHFDLNEFNLQDHRPRAQLAADLGPVYLGVLGQYDYYLLDMDGFLSEVTALPWLIIPEGDVARTEVFYRMRYRDFGLGNYQVRDGYNHAPGIRQVFYLGAADRYAYLGYKFDSEDPKDKTRNGVDSDEYGYSGHEANVGVRVTLAASLPVEASFAYRNERYRSESADLPGSDGRRHDDEYRVRAYAEIPWSLFLPNAEFAEYTSFALAYSYNLNESDNNYYDYDRHIGSLTIQVRY